MQCKLWIYLAHYHPKCWYAGNGDLTGAGCKWSARFPELQLLIDWLERLLWGTSNHGEGIVSTKPNLKSVYDFLGLLYCFIVYLSPSSLAAVESRMVWYGQMVKRTAGTTVLHGQLWTAFLQFFWSDCLEWYASSSAQPGLISLSDFRQLLKTALFQTVLV